MRKKTDAAESIPRRANFACGRMRSAGVLKVLARYAMHQSRISDSLGFDFTEHFIVEGQCLAPAGIMDVVDRRRSSILLRGEARGLDLIGGSRGVAIEGLHCFTRVFRQTLAEEIKLAEELIRHRDDVTATLLG